MNIKRGNIPRVYSTVRPTENDTSYSVPTLWIDTTGDKAYILVDVTSGVATWTAMGGVTVGMDAQNSVLSIATATNAPPTETSGARYIIGATGTPHANWDGALNNDIVEFDGAVWVATTPTEGTIVEVEDVNTIYLFITSWNAWQNQALTTTSSPTFASIPVPGTIGGTTPAAGTFTVLKATVSISAPVIADTTLSGTPVVITILDQATGIPYYFKVYPTKI